MSTQTLVSSLSSPPLPQPEHAVPSIPTIVNKCLDPLMLEQTVSEIIGEKAFEAAIDLTKLSALRKLIKLALEALVIVDKYDSSAEVGIQWVWQGKREIFTIFKANTFFQGAIPELKEQQDCQMLDEVMELSSKLSQLISKFQSKMELANQYYEIRDSGFKSIEGDLDDLGKSFEFLTLSTKDYDAEISQLTFIQIRSKIRESDLLDITNGGIKFVSMNQEETNQLSNFIDLEKKLNNSKAAMKYMPTIIELFSNAGALTVYPNEVLALTDKYSGLVAKINEIQLDTSNFKHSFISKRMNKIFDRLLNLIKEVEEDETRSEIVQLMDSIKDDSSLSIDQRQLFGLWFSKLCSHSNEDGPDEFINYRPVSRLNRRVFSSPVVPNSPGFQSLGVFEDEINLIERIRSDANGYSKQLEETTKFQRVTNSLSRLNIRYPVEEGDDD